MDPDATLEAAREAVRTILSDTRASEIESATADLVESFDALDRWLSGGGFPPAAWRWLTNGGE